MPREAYYLPSRKLVNQDDAALIQRARVPRSQFQNRWSRLTTFDAGHLVPFLVNEILPGDHVRYNITAYLRMQTALFPIFTNQRLDTFLFFVPARLVWPDWVVMMGEQEDPSSSINITVPIITSPVGGFAQSSLYDHMGIPCAPQIGAGETININALPLRAYNLIYNQWFRDQNVINSAPINTGTGPDPDTDYTSLLRAKSHDYFTSALPWPQKFTPLQTLFTGTAPVIGIGPVDAINPISGAAINIRESDNQVRNYPGIIFTDAAARFGIRVEDAGNIVSATNPPRIFADLAQATGVTINALRQAWLVQDLLERDARGGTRYTELIRSHFGVVNPDFRVQRPEYIGGGQTPINLTPIAQTTPTGGGGLGALGATGSAAGQHGGSYAATEHGYILGLINVRTELHYQQGLHRLWSRLTRYDFYFPALAGLGEQSILRKEIFMNGTSDDDLVFGYQERWHEYRTAYSEITNMFRSTAVGNIDEWHLAQHFSPAPTLSQAFLEDTPPMTRVLAAGAATNYMQYLADILIQRTITRPLPMYGTPATLARF